MRLKSIDSLRGLAITLVLFRHFEIVKVIGEIGWSGVDLFFVISGFLVSGLLFVEYKKTGDVIPLRFLVRRGLKIYPPFYLLILFTVIKALIVSILGLEGNRSFTLKALFSELFFVQNYFGGLWTHTWSLAVEEHFYLLLLILIIALISIKKLDNGFLFQGLVLLVAIGCLVMRAINYSRNPFTPDTHMFYTHLRIDSLFFGVLISYFYHFKNENYQLYVVKRKWAILILGIFCLSCMFVFPIDSFFMNTIGLSLTYVGYGALLVFCVHYERYFWLRKKSLVSLITRPFAFVGYYSYSIYLWHLAVLIYLVQPFFLSINEGAAFLIYFLLSIVFGIIFNKLVEKPVLKFRNSQFPQLLTSIR